MSDEIREEGTDKGGQESTSSVSLISYQVEMWLDAGLSNDDIVIEINRLKGENKFPSNLEYIDGFFDEIRGLSGSAFFDTNTNQTIIGFAGTNGENGLGRYAQDIVVNDILGLGVFGMDTDMAGTSRLDGLRGFMDSLENRGYSIDISTGHSLGSALCTILGREYNIPLIVTYNGAAANNALSSFLGGKKSEDNKYTGMEIRFVTDNDFLNIMMTGMEGDYGGERITIPSGTGHDMTFFVNSPLVQEIIISKLAEAQGYNKSDLLTVDFDKDGIADVYKSQNQLLVKNLFNVRGDSYGQGSNITISPEVMRTLSANITKMSIDDIDWIRNAVVLCEGKNEEIRGLKEGREEVLYNEVAAGLDEASLNKLLVAMNESHGELLKRKNKAMLEEIALFNSGRLPWRLETTSSEKRWSLGSEGWSRDRRSSFVGKINKAKKLAENILRLLAETSWSKEYRLMDDVVTYRYESLSDIVNGYVGITNGFISESKEVFEGRGIRTGKQDGIVEAVSEVIEVEKANIEEIKLSLERLSEMANGIADNFESADEYLASVINGGSGSYEIKEVVGSYEAYLEEHEVFDDVKGVLEAFDLQIEEASEILMTRVIDRYNLLLEPTRRQFESFVYELDGFGLLVNELDGMMGKAVKTENTVINTRFDMYTNEYIEDRRVEKESLGTLGSICGKDFVYALDYVKKNILPLTEAFVGVIGITAVFGNNITYLQDYFRATIERVVYSTMDLDEIVDSHKMISSMLERMTGELDAVVEQIESNHVGASIEMYVEAIGKSRQEIEYMRMMVDDCFGDNSVGVQPSLRTISSTSNKQGYSKPASKKGSKLS